MLKFIWFFCVCTFCLYAEVDFDCIVVGTSPTSMFEAIYQTCSGKKVLVVEKAPECGGAWKSINICGIQHADMGCHEFGNAKEVKDFFETFAGCKLVHNAPIKLESKGGNWGFYPSGGCYELIHNLELLMKKLGTVLLLNSKLETVFLDTERKVAEVKINGNRLTTSKIIVTSGAEIHFENPEYRGIQPTITKYPHLYLLISDPTPSNFTYTNYSSEGASRAMNVSRFVGLEGSGMQLIAIQLHNEKYLACGERFLNDLKKQNLIDPGAKIIEVGHYIYEQSACHGQLGIKNNQLFEFISTGHIGQINSFLPKWKQVMRPWKEVMASQ
ncbi:MAG TPA: hypothetical protein VLG76_02330 [Rhabdochlamydiaceae bacterium]|nr:hypothetical protein [Rhabdochlamydiaceae bacterium]